MLCLHCTSVLSLLQTLRNWNCIHVEWHTDRQTHKLTTVCPGDFTRQGIIKHGCVCICAAKSVDSWRDAVCLLVIIMLNIIRKRNCNSSSHTTYNIKHEQEQSVFPVQQSFYTSLVISMHVCKDAHDLLLTSVVIIIQDALVFSAKHHIYIPKGKEVKLSKLPVTEYGVFKLNIFSAALTSVWWRRDH